jgi:hypothetical protein
MDKAISAIEGITFRGREEEKRINLALDRIECARGAIETLIPLPLPRWETPEQWEKRTGEAWPDDGAVYFTHNTLDGTNVSWAICTYEKYKHYEKFNPGDGFRGVVTTEAGPPPYGWLPETGAQDD